MTPRTLTPEQVRQYTDDGFTILPGLFTAEECAEVIAHHIALAYGSKQVEGIPPRDTTGLNWGRTHNQHFHDPYALQLMLHPKLKAPLEQIINNGTPGEVDGIQTMYFWHGSEQRRHQDQYYLPECMSAWCAFVDVDEDNGTIWVLKGSHRNELVTRDALAKKYGHDTPFGPHYNDTVDELFEAEQREHGYEEVPVRAKAGDVVFFHGVLIHRGGPIGKPGTFRHVMANHYIPHNSTKWPYPEWPRHDFAGNKRLTKPGEPLRGEAAFE